jgi:hypothetical protein
MVKKERYLSASLIWTIFSTIIVAMSTHSATLHRQHKSFPKPTPPDSFDHNTDQSEDAPHAYVHRSHTNGDKKHVRDAYLEADHGVVFFKNGTIDRGHKHYIFQTAQDAHKKGNLEAFAIHDRDGLKAVFLAVEDCCTEYHGVWEESKEALDKHKIRELVDNWLHGVRNSEKKGDN